MTAGIRNFKRFLVGLFILNISAYSCKEPFEVEYGADHKSILVVEGYINVGPGITEIKLSRTIPLNQVEHLVAESGADVTIENSSGESFSLDESESGIYTSGELNLSAGDEYRLNIETTDGEDYRSEFIQPLLTPQIDSVTWHQSFDGVRIYISTHDPTNTINFYQWEYDEAWEIHSAFRSYVKYQSSGLVGRDSLEREQMYLCWKYGETPDVIIASTKNLVSSTISEKELIFIPSLIDDRLSVRYSVMIRQHALTQDAHRFFEILKKNNNNLGSFFDQQPSQLTGNIQSVSSSKPVIGYIGAYSTQSLRLDIINDSSLGWRLSRECRTRTVTLDSLAFYLRFNIPTEAFYEGPSENDSLPALSGVFAAPNYCVDCRVNGGTNKKPDFWDIPVPEP